MACTTNTEPDVSITFSEPDLTISFFSVDDVILDENGVPILDETNCAILEN
jgi:hypothetical protein